VETLIANPIHTIIWRPFTRISSARPMHQIQLPLFDEVVMHVFTMLAGSVSPVGHGTLIKAEGMDNGCDFPAIGE
jgi:hypothetical protein